ncbi:hypothetical protein BDV27DRAFT_124315 [Aspergillus caelatus]|uniref:Uncharacterized protein n=1 Tax=Aspergillus caelatus TaxID=61420 RepID=A0A5N7AD84_9EURO|nr:uncharacterized protein BDV27DRAFT_124315 [Aspergillus caelatus]KAE8367126.1 hypothetical protein BDV27DRAFT_124315 [Aspergillus caelatus]
MPAMEPPRRGKNRLGSFCQPWYGHFPASQKMIDVVCGWRGHWSVPMAMAFSIRGKCTEHSRLLKVLCAPEIVCCFRSSCFGLTYPGKEVKSEMKPPKNTNNDEKVSQNGRAPCGGHFPETFSWISETHNAQLQWYRSPRQLSSRWIGEPDVHRRYLIRRSGCFL